MNHWLSLAYREEPFRLFSGSHWGALAVVLAVGILLYLLRGSLRKKGANWTVRLSLAAVLFGQEALLQYLRVSNDAWYLQGSLPLHLCGISALLAGIMVLIRCYPLFEVTYFWGLAGATQALLTPDLSDYSYPHIIFFIFFVSHGAIIWACLFMTFVEGYRPTLRSVGKALLALNLLAGAVGLFNHWTGANYMYLAHKPEGASLLDYLGPWPWYILSLEGVALALFLILYLPFHWGREAGTEMALDMAERDRRTINRLPFSF